jgi:LPS-assembly protein
MRWCRVVAVLGMVALVTSVAHAQDNPKSEPLPPRQLPGSDRAAPLYMQADQLIYDTRGSRVIAQGSVEVYYNNYILTADQVIYDQSANTLIAQGNTQLKDPGGSVHPRAERFEAPDDFRDAFVRSLSTVNQLDTRIIPALR